MMIELNDDCIQWGSVAATRPCSMTIGVDGTRLDGALLNTSEMLEYHPERCTGTLVVCEQLYFKRKQKIELQQMS